MAKEKQTLKKSLLDQLEKVKPEEKINYLVNRLTNYEFDCQRNVENLSLAKSEADKLEKRLNAVERALSKAELSKSKLEELCRELSKTKKEEAERSVKRLRDLEKSHQETVEGFRTTLRDIQSSVDARKEQAKRMQDVEDISKSLTGLSEEYEKRLSDLKALYEDREKKVQDMMNTKDEELNWLRKEIEEMRGRIEAVFHENVHLKEELLVNEKKYRDAASSQIDTRKLIDTYEDKYNELAKTLTTSDQALERARKEMAKMNGQLIKLQGDAFKNKKRLEEANQLMLKLKFEKDELVEKMALKDRQLEQLQGLCRRLKNNTGASDESHNNGSATPALPSADIPS